MLPEREQWNLHFQATSISQGHDEFTSPYSGTNSLPPREPIRTSYTATLFLGARLWAGSEVFVNPELAGGRGVGGVTGIAGFPNGDIARVSKPEPTVSMARVFLRQTVGLGGEAEKVEPGPNQLAGARDLSRLTVTLGKISVGDIFDGNAYSHDARTQFMNWGLFENGAWDYPADTRGYTWGGALELIEPRWALRYGAMVCSSVSTELREPFVPIDEQSIVGEPRGLRCHGALSCCAPTTHSLWGDINEPARNSQSIVGRFCPVISFGGDAISVNAHRHRVAGLLGPRGEQSVRSSDRARSRTLLL